MEAEVLYTQFLALINTGCSKQAHGKFLVKLCCFSAMELL